MNQETHLRARKLLVAAQVEGISSDERNWLDRHLEGCDECSTEAERLAAAIQSIRALPVAASPDLVRRTSRMVRERAQQKQAARSHIAPVWIATAVSALSMVLTSPYVWSGLAWIGRFTHVPDVFWQVGFLMWWFMPATFLGAAAAWRSTKQQTEWGQK